MPDWIVTVWQGTKEIDRWLIENKENAEAVREAGSDVIAVYGERHYWMVTEACSAEASSRPRRRGSFSPVPSRMKAHERR